MNAYCNGLLEFGYLRLPKDKSVIKRLDFWGSSQEHRRLLKASEMVINKMTFNPAIQNISNPSLLHPDLHKRNVFVSEADPSNITAIIDWQSTGIEPLFVYADETPDLILPPATLPTPFQMREPSSTEDQTAQQNALDEDVTLCQKCFDVVLQGYMPRYREARYADENLLQIFRYCGTSWRDGAAPLRQELIELSQRWNELGLTGPCPYQPTSDELETHKRQFEDFDSYMALKDFLIRASNSNSDGWVPAGEYERAKEVHNVAFEEWMQRVREDDDPAMTEEKGRMLWPFDLP